MTRDQTANHQRALDARQLDLTVLMDGVTKPHNVSAIIRAADAVGIQQVHTTSTGELARVERCVVTAAQCFAPPRLL